MKPFIIATALALGLASSVQAAPGHDRGEHGARSEERAQKRLDHLTQVLNLTDAQQLQIKALMDEQRAARHDLFQRQRDEKRALHEAHKAQLDLILSAEQKARMEEIRAEHRQRFEGKRHGGRHGHGGKRGRGSAEG